MLAFIIKRIAQSIFVVVSVSLLVFLALYAVGSPVDMLLPPDADEEDIIKYSVALGLDKPIWDQYFIFLNGKIKDQI